MTYPKIPLPANLPFLINDPRPSARAAVSRIFETGDTMDLPDIMLALSGYWPVKVWFSEPITLSVRKTAIRIKSEEESVWHRCYRYKYDETTDNHVFRSFFWFDHAKNTFCYKVMRQGRRGYPFSFFDKVVKYEPVFKQSRKGLQDVY